MDCLRRIGLTFIPKKQYDTLEDAIKVAKMINKKENQIHKVVSYKCDRCHKFHVGKNGKLLEDKKRNLYINESV